MRRLVEIDPIREGLDYMLYTYPRLRKLCPDPYTAINREIAENSYHNLVRIVLGQQVSTAAARTIWERLLRFLGDDFMPDDVVKAEFDGMRACGLSARKVEYIKGMSTAILEGRLTPHLFDGMSDEDIAASIVALKGFGQWSVDMFLIFGLGRGDVWPVGDLGVRMGVQTLTMREARPDDADMARLGAEFSPFGTAAALLMWEIKDNPPSL